MNTIIKSLLFSFFLISAVAPVAAKDEPPEVSLEGLQLIEKNRRGHIYSDPDIDWSVYTQVILDPATVAFRRNWQRDQNRYHSFKIKTKDMDRIKAEMSELFSEVFTEELSDNGGYNITDQSGDEVMRIKPAIIDLDVFAPDTMSTAGRTTQFTESAGRMTLKLEIYDSVTGDLIAVLRERKDAPRRGYMQWTTSVSNRAEAKRMLRQWAKELVTRLDKARSTSKDKG